MMDPTGNHRHAWHWGRYAVGLARSGADETTSQSAHRWRSLPHPELYHYKIHKNCFKILNFTVYPVLIQSNIQDDL